MEDNFSKNSVTLNSELCTGCTNCIKRCPTQAIRVRNKKAHIKQEFCIDCGECVRVCPYHAKIPIYDPLSVMDRYRYTIALPAPSFYGQFNNLNDVNIILTALKRMGFDDVYEVSAAAEMVSAMSREYIRQNPDKKPFISTACPSVVKLIQVRFPGLIKHMLPFKAPVDIAAANARKLAMEKTGFPAEDIGIIFITPCPAKNTAVHSPIGNDKSEIDAVIAVKEVYTKILPYMKEVKDNPEELMMSGRIGISWGATGGEAGGQLIDSYLAADGIENVIRVLDDLEDQKFTDLNFIELNACSGGCVGGVLQVENPFVAKAKLKKLRKYMPVARYHFEGEDFKEAMWNDKVEFHDIYKLGSDLKESLELMNQIEEIVKRLPGLDCGTCGAPTCKALAEDVVRGVAKEKDCIYVLREYIHKLSDDLGQLYNGKE